MSPTKCVFIPIEKKDGHPGLWHIFHFSEALNEIWRTFTESKYSMTSTKFVFLSQLENKYGRHDLWLAEICLTSPNLQLLNTILGKLDWKEVVSVHYSLCFRANHKTKMAALASDWLTYFSLQSPLHPLNRIKEIWLKTSTQRPL